MPVFTGPPDIVADLVGVYRGAVPADIASQNRSLDEAYTLAELFGAVEAVIADWCRAAVLHTSTGSALDQIAIDHGLRRQSGEGDITLRSRLRIAPAAVTRPAILIALQQIVDANGGGTVFLIELPKDGVMLNRGNCCNRGVLIAGRTIRMVVAFIPASADCKTSCIDALRVSVSAGKAYLVEEYT